MKQLTKKEAISFDETGKWKTLDAKERFEIMSPTKFTLAVLVSVLIGTAIGISAGMLKQAQMVNVMETAGPIKLVNSSGRRFYQRCDKTGWCLNSFDRGNLSDAMMRQRKAQ